MYKSTKWLDRVVDADSGEVIQEGTDLSAGHFNNLEEGVSDAYIATALLAIAADQNRYNTNAEVIVVDIQNTQRFPFNDSAQRVRMKSKRNTTDYSVTAEVIEHLGNVGDISILYKDTSGFTVKYDGSATRAKIKLTITGGM